MSVPARKTSETTLRPSARLWGALLIGVVTILFTFPAGIALAVINWQRMGMARKAKRHLIIGLAAIYGLAFFLAVLVTTDQFVLPPFVLQVLYIVINVPVFFYLRREIDQDTDAYAFEGNEVYPANPLAGLAIGFGVLLVLLFLYFASIILLGSLGFITV
jgi:hypothetical protein